MDSNIMLSIFAGLALIVLFLIIVVVVKTQRKVAQNTALLRAKQEALEAKRAAKAAKENPDAAASGDDKTEGQEKSGANRNFRPST